MARTFRGPAIGGVVVNKYTGAPLANVTVTPSAHLWSDQEFQNSITTVTTKGDGSFAAFASPGQYTFTCGDASAAAIEAIEVLSPDIGTNAGGTGAQGAQGAAGAQGAQGAAGTGSQGAAGTAGAQGAAGSAGSQGASGAQGAAGAQGAQGASGGAGSQGNQGFQGTGGTADTPATVAASTVTTSKTLTVGQMNVLTGTGTDACVLTFPAAAAGARFELAYVQPASGGPATLTWPSTATCVFPNATTPVTTVTASKTDTFRAVCYDGTHFVVYTTGLNI